MRARCSPVKPWIRYPLARAGMRQSMSRKGNVYDNAFMESCFGTLKTELQITAYDDLPAARRELHNYIAYYHLQRRHSSLGYLTPAQFEHRNLPPFRSESTTRQRPFTKLY